MPIVIPRSGGVVVSTTPMLTAAQKDAAWERIIKNWGEKHPEKLKALSEESRDKGA